MRAITRVALVRRLLTLEAVGSQDQEALVAAAERVLDRLRAHLSQRIGQEGFRTLLARALTLTTPRFPRLKAVRVEADGSLSGLRRAADAGPQEAQDDVTPQEAVEGTTALAAHLIELLITFIGEDLTLRILSTVSPTLSLPAASDDAAGWENERP